ncbi:bacterial DNA-binding family protein [Candidatus Phytoplasma oryzae]|uniref:Bacterial DNA-binding family protein n=1 Tax=Candidatus Phytoplasma oryzae TaxID=203274 RepID=A0A139JQY1_9MOLU|nr:HU family DNA-binding protein [Candidatus Phytoplasma oryzae]KXT29391.1 bacterial DNA-binding family protein [Candidatus Phytoplasma oryzae]RAM57974.1 hypothetical protein DH96_00190 [Candidatus Phytoplasma oryzae]
MTKLKLISKISEISNISKKEANDFFNTLNNVIIDALKNQEKVFVPGLGIIQLRDRKERKCKVPKINRIVNVPAHITPVFKMNKKFKSIFKSFYKN